MGGVALVRLGVFSTKEGAWEFIRSRPMRDSLDPGLQWHETEEGKIRPSRSGDYASEGWTFEAHELK